MTAHAQNVHSNHADTVGELFTNAEVGALNAELAGRGIAAEQIISILPVAGQKVLNPTEPQFRVLYRLN